MSKMDQSTTIYNKKSSNNFKNYDFNAPLTPKSDKKTPSIGILDAPAFFNDKENQELNNNQK